MTVTPMLYTALPAIYAERASQLAADGGDVLVQARFLGAVGYRMFGGTDEQAFDNFSDAYEGEPNMRDMLVAPVQELVQQVFTYLNDSDTEDEFPAVEREFKAGFNAERTA